MAIRLKSLEEIDRLRRGGHILATILHEVAAMVRPGVAIADLDAVAEAKIRAAGGVPAFKNYVSPHARQPFPSTLCVSINEHVVHGIAAPGIVLQQGEIVSLDIGMVYDNLYTDMAITVGVGTISPAAQKLLDVTAESLVRGIAQAKAGKHVQDIGRAVQTYVESQGMSVVRDLVGHGVGFSVHEDPQVPNFVDRGYPNPVLEPGLVIAIEPMVTAGKPHVKTLRDGWTVAAADKSLAAHFEHTIAITTKGPVIITAL